MRRSGAASLGPLVDASLNSLQIARKIKEHTAPLVWAEVVGEQVAGATEILGVFNGVLRVSTKSSVWAHELTFYKDDIVRRLNLKLGCQSAPVILDIHFQNRGVHAPTAPEPTIPELTAKELDAVPLSATELSEIEHSVREIADPDLRARMRRVRLTDLKRKAWRADNGWVPCPECGLLIAPLPSGGWRGCSCRRVTPARKPE